VAPHSVAAPAVAAPPPVEAALAAGAASNAPHSASSAGSSGPADGSATAAASPQPPDSASRRGTASELALRIAFTVVAVPAVLVLAYRGGLYLATLLAVLAAVGAWELYRVARSGGVEPISVIGVPLAAALPIAASAAPPGVYVLPPGWAAMAVLLVLAAAIWVRGAQRRPLASVAVTMFGAMYTGGMLSFGYAIRYHRYAVGDLAGTALVMLPVLLTWTNDVASYAVGRMLGRRKLLPAVSPGKTVAGAVGGVVLTMVVCWAYVRWVLRPSAELGLAPWGIVVFALVISVAAQIGDLAESLFKREAGVKDTSRIIPGHGGVLDRIDSLLFVLPTAYLLFDLPGLLLPAPA